MFDVKAIGEFLIDFTPGGKSKNGNQLYEQNPGGAPANVLTAVVKQGGKAALITSVGKDNFGDFLCKTAENLGISTQGIQFTNEAITTLAFISLNDSGDRSFSFCRNPGADQKLNKDKLNLELLNDCKIFHFGSLSLSDDPSRSTTLFAAEYAKNQGKIISYDPNWRAPLWKSLQEGINGMKLGLQFANVLKLSQEELELLSDTDNLEQGTCALFEKYPSIKLIVVTLGPRGCYYRLDNLTGILPTYETKIVDTTGAGDAFWGALLLKLSSDPECLYKKDSEKLEKYLDWANASGTLCAAGRGAIPSIPTEQEILAMQKSCPKLVIS